MVAMAAVIRSDIDRLREEMARQEKDDAWLTAEMHWEVTLSIPSGKMRGPKTYYVTGSGDSPMGAFIDLAAEVVDEGIA